MSDPEVVIRTEEELPARFPELAQATEETRRFFRSGEGEGWLASQNDWVVGQLGDRPFEFFLLADAAGIARYLEPPHARAFAIEADVGVPPVVAGPLGELMRRLP